MLIWARFIKLKLANKREMDNQRCSHRTKALDDL
jgi:hypothetical protein